MTNINNSFNINTIQTTYNINTQTNDDLKQQMRFLQCIYKKIYFSSKKNDEEYINNKNNCDTFMHKIFPAIYDCIQKINKNEFVSIDQLKYIQDMALKYKYEQWYKNKFKI